MINIALVYCSECGKKISDKAEVCINCGAPTNIKNNSDLTKIVKYRDNGVALGILFNFFAYIYSWKEDYWKFWLMLVIYFLLFVLFIDINFFGIYLSIFLIVIIIIDFSTKKDSEFYIWKKR